MMDSRIKTEIMDEIMEIGASMEDMGLVNTFEGNLSIKDGDLFGNPQHPRLQDFLSKVL